jgi:hypothetical protein
LLETREFSTAPRKRPESRRILGETRGVFLSMRDFVDRMRTAHPLAPEETFQTLVLAALKKTHTVYIDDVHLLNAVVCCG